jgi:hypothetical protein
LHYYLKSLEETVTTEKLRLNTEYLLVRFAHDFLAILLPYQ